MTSFQYLFHNRHLAYPFINQLGKNIDYRIAKTGGMSSLILFKKITTRKVQLFHAIQQQSLSCFINFKYFHVCFSVTILYIFFNKGKFSRTQLKVVTKIIAFIKTVCVSKILFKTIAQRLRDESHIDFRMQCIIMMLGGQGGWCYY